MPIPTPNIAHNAEIVGDTLHNISLNYKWRQIVGGQLSRLLHRKYWTGTEAEIDTALNQLHDLIHDLYTTEANQVATYRQAVRGSSQAIPANTLTKIQFQTGALPPQDWDIPTTVAGVCTVTARVAVVSGSNALQYARLLHNGNEIARDDNRSTGQIQYFEMTQILEVADTDYFNLEVYAQLGTTVQIAPFTPLVSMVIIE